MEARRFDIRVDSSSRLLLRVLFGVTEDSASVAIADADVRVRFGRWEISVPTANVTYWSIEGPWHWITAIGVRRSIRHGDLTFAGSPRGGVRLDLGEPVKWKLFNLPALYVGVEDLEGFAAELTARGIPGEDLRERT